MSVARSALELDQESPPNNKKGLVASLTKTHQRASYGLAPSFQARFTSISRLVARKPLARYGATQGRARSRLAPPATLQISQWSWGGSVPHVAEGSIPDVA